MKKFSKIIAFVLVSVLMITVVGCGKKENYEDYLGYQFSGKDPWGYELAITIRTLEDDKLTWTYTDVYGEGESSITIYDELTTEFKDGSTPFKISGDDTTYSYEYNGTLTLKDGKLSVKYIDGALTTKSSEGNSASHQVGPLEDSEKTVTLTKVEDNA